MRLDIGFPPRSTSVDTVPLSLSHRWRISIVGVGDSKQSFHVQQFQTKVPTSTCWRSFSALLTISLRPLRRLPVAPLLKLPESLPCTGGSGTSRRRTAACRAAAARPRPAAVRAMRGTKGIATAPLKGDFAVDITPCSTDDQPGSA